MTESTEPELHDAHAVPVDDEPGGLPVVVGEHAEPEDTDVVGLQAHSPFADAEDEDPESLVGDEVDD